METFLLKREKKKNRNQLNITLDFSEAIFSSITFQDNFLQKQRDKTTNLITFVYLLYMLYISTQMRNPVTFSLSAP